MKVIEIKSINTDTRKFGAFKKEWSTISDEAVIESLVIRVTMEVNILEYFTFIELVGSENIFLHNNNGLPYVETKILDEKVDKKLNEILGTKESREAFNQCVESNEYGIFMATVPLGFTRYKISVKFKGRSVILIYGSAVDIATIRFKHGWRDIVKDRLEKICKNVATTRYEIGDTTTTISGHDNWGPNTVNLIAVANDIRYVEIKKPEDISDPTKLKQFYFHIEEALDRHTDVYIACRLCFQDLLSMLRTDVVDVLAVDVFNTRVYLRDTIDFFSFNGLVSPMYLGVLKTCLTTPFSDELLPSIIPLGAPITFLIRINISFDSECIHYKNIFKTIARISIADKLIDIMYDLKDNGWFSPDDTNGYMIE